jgi:hypothetical protein
MTRMKASTIKLPIDDWGNLDVDFMESYIQSLLYSRSI